VQGVSESAVSDKRFCFMVWRDPAQSETPSEPRFMRRSPGGVAVETWREATLAAICDRTGWG